MVKDPFGIGKNDYIGDMKNNAQRMQERAHEYDQENISEGQEVYDEE